LTAGSAQRPDLRRVATIAGPTAVGKTAVAIAVGERVGGEIVSADSRQVYRGMDIGTAKPTPAERSRVRHHLIDVIDPTETYDASRFARDAEEVIARLLEAGVAPLVVGGTGFYLSSLFEGLFEGPGRDPAVRAALNARVVSEGPQALHAELAAVDPPAAARIHPNDAARIVRALEVYRSTGTTMSEWHDAPRRRPRYAPAYFVLTAPREKLHERIARRVERMVADGLFEEVALLRASGALVPGTAAASAVGYREVLTLLEEGRSDLTPAIGEIVTATRRYAKRQMTWFRSLGDARWLDVEALGMDGAAAEIAGGMGDARRRR